MLVSPSENVRFMLQLVVVGSLSAPLQMLGCDLHKYPEAENVCCLG